MCMSMPASDSDDVWGDGSDSEHEHGAPRELEREAAARQRQFYNSGYRDGTDAGKEKTLQEGFNLGFAQGMQAGYERGAFKAVVKTLQITCGQLPGSSQWQPQVDAMVSRVEGPKDREVMLGALRQLLQSPLSEEHVPESVREDPDMHQAFQTAIQQSQDPSGQAADMPGANLALPDVAQLQEDLVHSIRQLGFPELCAWRQGQTTAAQTSTGSA